MTIMTAARRPLVAPYWLPNCRKVGSQSFFPAKAELMTRYHPYLSRSLVVVCFAVAFATLAPAQTGLAQAWKIIPPTQPAPDPPSDPRAPSAEIGDFRVYPDRLGVDSFGLSRYGLLASLDFRVRNMEGRSGRVDIFFRPQGGDFIPGAEGFYASIEKLVSVRRPFQCLTNDDRFEKVGLFIPRDELRLVNGSYNLEAVILIRSSDRLLSKAVFSFPYRHNIPKDTGPQE